MTLAWIVLASLGGGVLSVLLAAVVAFRAKAAWVHTLVSYAVGALLGVVFLDLLPHVFEQSRHPGRAAACILAGILGFFVLEKLLLWRHHHHADDEPGAEPGSHAHYHAAEHDHGRSGLMITVGDSFHNFTDGLIIASAFLADVRLGVVTSVAIVAHEIPQEIGDFIVLLHSGFSRRQALALNVLAGLASVAGGVVGWAAISQVSQWIPEILAVSAASMIYVAVADLIPGLHRRTAPRETLIQVTLIALGVASIWAIEAALGADR